MKDTKIQSLIRGRLGAAVLAAVSFVCIAFGVTGEDQAQATELTNQALNWVSGGSSLVAAILAFFSKLREV